MPRSPTKSYRLLRVCREDLGRGNSVHTPPSHRPALRRPCSNRECASASQAVEGCRNRRRHGPRPCSGPRTTVSNPRPLLPRILKRTLVEMGALPGISPSRLTSTRRTDCRGFRVPGQTGCYRRTPAWREGVLWGRRVEYGAVDGERPVRDVDIRHGVVVTDVEEQGGCEPATQGGGRGFPDDALSIGASCAAPDRVQAGSSVTVINPASVQVQNGIAVCPEVHPLRRVMAETLHATIRLTDWETGGAMAACPLSRRERPSESGVRGKSVSAQSVCAGEGLSSFRYWKDRDDIRLFHPCLEVLKGPV